ncbi:pyridoxamine 5'-phosphate oxidase family protein [Streptomyces sp. NPDC059169]|uniref:pyridoxamine 5'-phosphate oxidase family protein n=1 Tax=Streptomyces sp. NPDC059169 TaxID=3346754 RepID=UPI003691DAE1
MGTTWKDFSETEPDFAATVGQRFQKYKHHVLGTLRADGSPRLTGIEADFRSGELWLGMMQGSRKARDLQRDPRFAIHANPGPDTSMEGGDVRISGRAVEITEGDVKDRFQPEEGEPLPFHLFRVELVEVVRTRVEGDELVVRSWRPGSRLRTLRRGNDDSPPREESA